MLDGLYLGMSEGPLYWVLFFATLIFSLVAQASVKSTFHKYSAVRTAGNLTGAEAARRVLYNNGITNVRIERVAGDLSDHFDPRSNTIRLSDQVYDKATVAAVGVAAHEAGHACQHAHGYAPIQLRNAVLPLANIGQTLAMPLAFAGLIFQMFNLITIGIVLFSAVMAFQLITLPVEFNASSRAINALSMGGMLSSSELKGSRKVLTAAGMTYVAGTAMAAVQLLRLILLANSSRQRD